MLDNIIDIMSLVGSVGTIIYLGVQGWQSSTMRRINRFRFGKHLRFLGSNPNNRLLKDIESKLTIREKMLARTVKSQHQALFYGMVGLVHIMLGLGMPIEDQYIVYIGLTMGIVCLLLGFIEVKTMKKCKSHLNSMVGQ